MDIGTAIGIFFIVFIGLFMCFVCLPGLKKNCCYNNVNNVNNDNSENV
jgi:hypothetical protein